MNNQCNGVEREFFKKILCETINETWEIIKYHTPQEEIHTNVFSRDGQTQIIFPFNPYYQADRNIFHIITHEPF